MAHHASVGVRSSGRGVTRDHRTYLAACALYRDHASYLREWIEFHRLVGVERFYLYSNFSADDHLQVLAPYVLEGVVVVHDWPVPFVPIGGRPNAITAGFDHCLKEHGRESR